ncbi:hypothetical protein [Streptomyces sp. RerS4]|uniref:hypothetical protein n=1 Tax=Streptomyces sp. RerS4 TaxID=2942449 RepID=UPI00201C7EF8|nr:hypothetical protein [Streptomyces sp. RerS4]UQX01690.1 hypothetical protein M4D82_15105 [Streptomyces sp. RerS4]
MARSRLSEVDYRLDTFTDAPSGRRYAEVADAAVGSGRSGRGAGRGWGRIYVDLDGPARWSVQVPHPLADRDTERLGAEVLRGAPGGVMVLAGAHREAASGAGGRGEGDEDASPEKDPADMAHRTDSVFHAVVTELTRRGLPGIQLHGFADSSAPGARAVVSTGAGDAAGAEAAALADALEGAWGARRGRVEGRVRGAPDGRGAAAVCRAWADPCPLAGRTNQQGRLAAERGTRFLHLELARAVRSDAGASAGAVRAITYVTQGWAGRG